MQIGDSVSPSASSATSKAPIVQDVYTLLPEYLLPRHILFPKLRTQLQITPAYSEAPRDGAVTVCYTALSHIKELDAWSSLHGKSVVRAACAIIRDVLADHGGYECRENSGNFLLSFHSPDDALRFCIRVQHELMHVRGPFLSSPPLHQHTSHSLMANRSSGKLSFPVFLFPSRWTLTDGTLLCVTPLCHVLLLIAASRSFSCYYARDMRETCVLPSQHLSAASKQLASHR
jgi:hypothetical protein